MNKQNAVCVCVCVCVCVYAMEYYLAIKRNEILTHASTGMNLENIVLSKISQLQKDTYCMISFT